MLLKLLASLILGIGKHKRHLSIGATGLVASVLTAQTTQVGDVTQDPLLNAIIQIVIAISTIIAIFKKNKNK